MASPRFLTVLNSATPEIAFLLLSCCLATSTISATSLPELKILEIPSLLLGGITLFYAIGWLTYIFISGKQVKPMPSKPRNHIEWCSFILFAYWFLATHDHHYAWPWMIGVVWIAFNLCIADYIKNKNLPQ